MQFMVGIEIPVTSAGLLRQEALDKLVKALDHSTARNALSTALGGEVRLSLAEDGLIGFFQAIESTGGVIKLKTGCHVPVGDEEWIDLGEAYLAACAAFDRGPMIVARDDHED
jgi:hypothetical protein